MCTSVTGMTSTVQGTVATFDADRRCGTVLLDDGSELPFAADAFDSSGLRLVRLGQRLRLVRGAAGEVTDLSLITMG